MRIRGGSRYLLAILVFAAAVTTAPLALHAQNQDESPPIYVTPHSNNSARPLFLQRLFGANGSDAGLGRGKPYDFSHRNDRAPDNTPAPSLEEAMDRIVQEQRARALPMEQAHEQLLAQLALEQQQKNQELQAQIRTKAIADAAAHRPTMPPNIPHISRSAQPAPVQKRHHGRNTASSGNNNAPAIYNRQPQNQNAHAPIFFH